MKILVYLFRSTFPDQINIFQIELINRKIRSFTTINDCLNLTNAQNLKFDLYHKINYEKLLQFHRMRLLVSRIKSINVFCFFFLI